MKCLTQIDGLRHAIKTGQLEPGAMVGTEFAFSQEWEMSRNTVRRGIERLVEEGLLERRPGKGLFVRAPHTTTRTIQLVVPDLSWSHIVRMARGAQSAGRELGVQVQIYDAHGEMEWDLEVLRRLPNGPTDGAIISSLHHRRFSEVLFELKSVGYPFVLVDQRLQDLEVPTVEIDNYGGGYLVGKKLAEVGHRRVAFLGPMSLLVVNDRLNGFRDAMLDAGVLFDRSLVVDLGGDGLTDWINKRLDTAEEAVLRLLQSPNPPTALFDGSGDLAPLVYRAVQQLKLDIPKDVSIVTFDDAATFSQFLDPQVTQLKHSWDEVGRAALKMLLSEMNSAKRSTKRDHERHVVLEGEWIEGASIAPAASAGEQTP